MDLQLNAGLSVRDINGKPRGVVGYVQRSRFCVCSGDQAFWLDRALVFTVDTANVALQCNTSGLLRYATTLDGSPLGAHPAGALQRTLAALSEVQYWPGPTDARPRRGIFLSSGRGTEPRQVRV